MQRTEIVDTERLLGTILQGIQNKKGSDIVTMDLTQLENTFCQFFIICHGNSNIQVSAIAESVQDLVKKDLLEKVWHKEGLENAQWVLLDYGDIVVHIFQEEFRNFYNLEELWADAKIEHIVENDLGEK